MEDITINADQEIHLFKQPLIVPAPTMDNFATKTDLTQKSELKYNTQSVLESVCNDFENIDVMNPNANFNFAKSVELHQKTSKEIATNVSFSVATDRQQHLLVQEDSVKSNTASTLISTEENNEQIYGTFDTADNTDILPVQNYTTLENMPADNETISSSNLAELADAEIVHTGSNSVSIVITNPRIIQILRNSESHSDNVCLPPNVVSENDFTPEDVYNPAFTVVEEDMTANNIILPEVLTETVYSDQLEELPKGKRQKKSSLTASSFSRAIKTEYKSSHPRNKGNVTKARRITVKMKNELRKKLLEKSFLLCPMLGCSKSFKTLANFITHYKFCTGQKDFKHCPYCKSVIFSSNKAVLHHMAVEHPEKLSEYKATLPNAGNYIEDPYERAENNRTFFSSTKANSKENSISRYQPSKYRNAFQGTATQIKSEFDSLKEIKKGVRFDNIVSKIHSACDEKEVNKEKDESFLLKANSFPPQKIKTQIKASKTSKRRRFYMTEKVVENNKYFEDVCSTTLDKEKDAPETNLQKMTINTKSRLVLDQFKQYERYIESLKLTRDWSTKRRTYSKSARPKINVSDNENLSSTSLNCNMVQNKNTSVLLPRPTFLQDIHQLSDTSIHHSFSDEFSQMFQSTDVNLLMQSPPINESLPKREPKEKKPFLCNEKIVGYPEFTNNIYGFDKKPVPCYLQYSTPHQKNSSTNRKPQIITYGKSTPVDKDKKPSDVLDFDMLLEDTYRKIIPRNYVDNHTNITIDYTVKTPKKSSSLPLKENIKEEQEQIIYFVRESKKKKPLNRFHAMSKSLKKAKRYQRCRKNFCILGKSGPSFEFDPKKLENVITSPETVVLEENVCTTVDEKENCINDESPDLFQIQELNPPQAESMEVEKMNESALHQIVSDKAEKSTKSLKPDTLSSSQGKPILNEVTSFTTEKAKTPEPDNLINFKDKTVSQKIIITDTSTTTKKIKITELDVLTSYKEKSVPQKVVLTDTSNTTKKNKIQELDDLTSSKDKRLLQKVIPRDTSTTAEKTKIPELDLTSSNDKVSQQVVSIGTSPITEKTKISELDDFASSNDKTVSQQVVFAGTSPMTEKTKISKLNELTNSTDKTVSQQVVSISTSTITEKTNVSELKSLSSSKEKAMSQKVIPTDMSTKTGNTEILEFDNLVSSKEETMAAKVVRRDTSTKTEKAKIPELDNMTNFNEKIVSKKVVTSDTNTAIKRGRGRPRKSDNQLNISDDTFISSNKNPLRKSGRVKNLVDSDDKLELVTDEVKSICVEKNLVNYGDKTARLAGELKDASALLLNKPDQAEFKRGRGRPRKNIKSSKKDITVCETSNSPEPFEMKNKDADPVLDSNDKQTCVLPPKKRKIKELDEPKTMEDSELSLLVNCKRNIKDSDDTKTKKYSELSHPVNQKKDIKEVDEPKTKGDSGLSQPATCTLSRLPKKNYKTKEEINLQKDPDYIEQDLLVTESHDEEEEDSDYSPRKKKHKQKRREDTHRKMFTTYDKFTSYGPPLRNNIDQSLFVKYKPRLHMFECLSKYDDFFPKETNIAFKFNSGNVSNTKADFITLKRFESLNNTHGPIGSTIFAGGPITCAAFVPTPRDTSQYCTLCTTNNNYGVIQFYNLNLGENITERCLPQLDLAIVHNEGAINEIAFCPEGCFEYPTKSKGTLPRLALLAVSVGDSIKVYPIPHPNFLKMHSTIDVSSKFYKLKETSVILRPLFGEPSLISRSCICTSLSWKKDEFCDKIAAGYSNGMVYIWVLNESSNSITAARESEIMPFVALKAHGTPVTSLNFHPMFDRFIVTSGIDRTLKFFDMFDGGVPFCSVKRGLASQSVFDSDLCGAFVTLHDGISLSTCFKDCGTEEMEDNIFGLFSTLIEKSAFSDAINALAIADANGSIFLSCINKHSLTKSEHFKLQYNNYEIFRTKVVPLCDSPKDVTGVVSHITEVVHVVNELVDNVPASVMDGMLQNVIPCKQFEMSTTQVSHLRPEELPTLNFTKNKTTNLGAFIDAVCDPIETVTIDSRNDNILTYKSDAPQKALHSGMGDVVEETDKHSNKTSLQSDFLITANESNNNKIENVVLDQCLSSESILASKKVESEIKSSQLQESIYTDNSMLSECSSNSHSLSMLSDCSMASNSHLSPESKGTEKAKDTPSTISGNSSNRKGLSNACASSVTNNEDSVVVITAKEPSQPVENSLDVDDNHLKIASSCSKDQPQSTNLCVTELESNTFEYSDESCMDINDSNISFPSSHYSLIVKNHGLIFTDIDLSGNNGEREKLPALSLGQSIFSSVKTVAWNPNSGLENWLLSGSNSGIARLRCLSELNINQENEKSVT